MANQGFNTAHGFDTGPPPPRILMNQHPFPPRPFPQPQYPYAQFSAYPPHYPPQVDYPPFPFPNHPPQQQQPQSQPTYPGLQFGLQHSTSLPAGYAYLYPPSHTYLHILSSPSPPWQTHSQLLPHTKLIVPTCLSFPELFKSLGLTNADAKKNIIYEVVEKGNGRWSKGMVIVGDNKERMKLTLAGIGWDETRTGAVGERPAIWLWCCKN